jgi:hypothetical protein
MELTLSMWVIAVVCAIMIGMAKTGVNGIGTLVVPIMAYEFGGMPSAGLVLPMLVMADVFGVAYYHRSAIETVLIIPRLLAFLPDCSLGRVYRLLSSSN